MNTRSMATAGCGLLLGLISVIAIGFTIRSVTLRTLSLAYRMDADRTIFFVRTTDLTTFARAITAYAPMMTAPPSQLASLPRGASYEFALVSGTGNDQPAVSEVEPPAVSEVEPLQWIIYVHTGNRQHMTFVSADDPGLFLDVRDIGRSLGRSPVFLSRKRNAANLAFVDLQRLPLAGSTLTLARSIVGPFRNAMITADGLRGQLILQKKEKTVLNFGGPTADLLPLKSAPPAVSEVEPLLSIATGDPHAILVVLAASFQQQDEQLYEGLKGVMSAKLADSAHRTDLVSTVADLLSQSTRLLITGKREDGSTRLTTGGSTRLTTGGLRFVVTGHARNRQVADRWIEDLRSATIPVRVRTQVFFNENSRVDVIADTSAYKGKMINGWTMTTVGSGSSRQFTIAGKGDQIILGNDPDLLLIASNHLDQKGMPGNGPRSLDGTVDIAWLTKAAGDLFPFLASDIRSLSEALLRTNIRRMDWSAKDGGNSVVIQFRLTSVSAN